MGTLPSGTRRDTPNSHSKTVRLVSPAGGEEHIGYFLVPADAVTFKEHSNDVLRYDRVVVEKINDWIKWKDGLELTMVSKPIVYVPVDSPVVTEGADPVDGGDMRVYVRATFRRKTPAFMSLDLFLERKDMADRYGVNFEDKVLAENPMPATLAHMIADEHRNPMKLAEQRRQKLGLKRELLIEEGTVVGARVHR